MLLRSLYHLRRFPMPSPTPLSTLLLDGSSELDLSTAASLLESNRLVAFPTETVYGLGANAFCASAVLRIFEAKCRPADNPLIVHISSPSQLSVLTPPLSKLALSLIDAFWPGPLTLVLPVLPESKIAAPVLAGLDTIAVRLPKHPVALALLAKAGVPVAAPSANRSGRPSPTCAKHVVKDLDGRVEAVVDGGELWRGGGWGVESTVVEIRGEGWRLLRPGVIGRDEVRKVVGTDEMTKEAGGVGRSPGMKYRHYAPKAKVEIVRKVELGDRVKQLEGMEQRVGVVGEKGVWERNVVEVEWGWAGLARGLYRGLRAFDGEEEGVGQVDVILVVVPEEEDGMKEAVEERLRKAAAGGGVDEQVVACET